MTEVLFYQLKGQTPEQVLPALLQRSLAVTIPRNAVRPVEEPDRWMVPQAAAFAAV